MRVFVFVLALIFSFFGTFNSVVTADDRPTAVFIGSSSIARWTTLEQDFPEYHIINRGVGGLLLPELLKMIDTDVVSFSPRIVIVYTGENYLWAGGTPEEAVSQIREFTGKVHAALPRAQIVFISIKPSAIRWNHREMTLKVPRTNALLREFVAENRLLRFADVFTPMLFHDGNPRSDLFTEDRLHLNMEGYRLWKRILMGELNSM